MSPTSSTPAPDAQGSTLDVMADRLFQRGLGLSRGYARGVVEHILTGDPDASPERKAAALARLAPAAEASGLADAVRKASNALKAIRPILSSASPDFPGIDGRLATYVDAVKELDALLTPAGGADAFWRDGRRTPENGCCSAIEPCPHQQLNPNGLCEVCTKAAALSAQTGGADAAAGGSLPSVEALAGVMWDEDCPGRITWKSFVESPHSGDQRQVTNYRARAAAIIARLTPASGVDAPVVGNMVLVPREPTPEMCEAGDLHELMLPSAPYDRLNAIWSAMLDAASSASHPTAPEQSGEATDMVRQSAESFQARVKPWVVACFGEEVARDVLERQDRFVEEALELVQSLGYDRGRVAALTDYVFNREPGNPRQEIGGTMTTLAALCNAIGQDMHEAGETELARVWTKVDRIREKQAAKPKGSALPVALATPDGEAAAGADDGLDIEGLSALHAQIPAGPYQALRCGDGHLTCYEVRAFDTRPGDRHHWPYRLLASIPGQIAGCDDAVFDFVAGIVNAWPQIAARLAPTTDRSTGSSTGEAS